MQSLDSSNVDNAHEPKLTKLPSSRRFHTEAGWLDSWHTFSFANHFDPERQGFRKLRVINEDRVVAQRGFGLHSHRDMEIITYVISGTLSHRDSMGNEPTIGRGEVQRMTAGSLVTHSEMNQDARETVHFLQIWILPNQLGLPPSYEQKHFTDAHKLNRWCCIASAERASGGLLIHQDVSLWATILQTKHQLSYDFAEKRHGWLQLITGSLTANGVVLSAGDGLAISQESHLLLDASEDAELLLFDLA